MLLLRNQMAENVHELRREILVDEKIFHQGGPLPLPHGRE
jgi:hypothetical protein